MKKVVKVSIGNLVFVVEEDACSTIKKYLDNVGNHYYNKENGNEIIEGIEERMAELLIDRVGADRVVSISDVQEIISILGYPSDFEDPDFREPVRGSKKLYRDGSNKIIAGICSGLGAYFNIDAVLVRILSAILFISFCFTTYAAGSGFMIISYIVLWIIIPKAKTIEQKYAMYGESLDLSDIQESIKRGVRQINKGVRNIRREAPEAAGTIVNIFASILGIAFTIIAMIGIIVLSFLLLGMEVFKDIFLFEVLDYIDIGSINPVYLKILFISILLFPFIGMLYTGLRMLFGFKSPKWRPGLIIFLLWFLSVLLLSVFSIKTVRYYMKDSEFRDDIALNDTLSILYIDLRTTDTLPESSIFFSANRRDLSLSWIDGVRHNREIVIYPDIHIVRQSDTTEMRMQVRTNAVSHNHAGAYLKAQKAIPIFSITDSLLTIDPEIYTRENKWNGTRNQIVLYLPEDVKVQVINPIPHDFSGNVRWHWKDDILWGKFRWN